MDHHAIATVKNNDDDNTRITIIVTGLLSKKSLDNCAEAKPDRCPRSLQTLLSWPSQLLNLKWEVLFEGF